MKKILLLLFSLSLMIFLSCEDDSRVFEPEVTKSSIFFPFESRDNGKFMALYRNNTNETVSISLAYAQKLIDNSQNYDFCPDVMNLKNKVLTSDWVMINLNYPIMPESSVQNQNDHPNLFSYALPKGTYIVFPTETEGCSKEQYEVFDINSNDIFE